MKRLIVLVFASLALVLSHATLAASQQDTPEGRTKAFYTWYLTQDLDLKNQLLDRRIYDFVEKDTVDLLRSDYRRGRMPTEADYFLRVQDEDTKDWLAHIATHPPVMLGDVAVVPVTFGSAGKVSVLVFMRQIDGIWKITKTDDLLGYQTCACGL